MTSFLTSVLGPEKGYLLLGYRDATKPKGTPGRWTEAPFAWPSQRAKVTAAIKDAHTARLDVYFRPAVMKTKRGTKGNAVAIHTLSFELDAPPADPDLLKQLNPTLVSSGTPGHQHVYVHLSEPVDAQVANRLSKALATILGVKGSEGGKWEDNGPLRVPGTSNFKTDPPRKVRLTKRSPLRWNPDELEDLIASVAPATLESSDDTRVITADAEPVNQARLPVAVRAALNNTHGDDSGKLNRLVRTCFETGKLTVGQAITLALDYEPARAHHLYDDRIIDDVRRIWAKKEAQVNRKPTPALRASKTSDGIEPRRTEFTLDSLMNTEFPPLRFVAEGLLPEGLALLVAAPKTGKSFWLLDMALGVVQGKPALGSFPTEDGEVLFLSLEGGGGRSLQTRIRKLSENNELNAKHDIFFKTEWSTMAGGAIEELEGWLDEHPKCTFVVIDTLAAFKGDAGAKIRDAYTADYLPAKNLSDLAHRKHVCIVIAHHDRKAEAADGDYLNLISGTKGLPAASDVIIMLQRTQRNGPKGKMYLVAREMEGNEWDLTFKDAQWRIADSTDLVKGKAGDVLQLLKKGRHTASEIAANLEITRNYAQKTLNTLKNKGFADNKDGVWYARADAPGHDDPAVTRVIGNTKDSDEPHHVLPYYSIYSNTSRTRPSAREREHRVLYSDDWKRAISREADFTNVDQRFYRKAR